MPICDESISVSLGYVPKHEGGILHASQLIIEWG